MEPANIVAALLENDEDDFDVSAFLKRNFQALGPADRSHLHVSSSDGGLYDTRKPDWHKGQPLRQNYQRHHARIFNVKDFKATWRARGNSNYPLAFILSDGEAICEQCVEQNLRRIIDSTRTQSNDGWRVIGVEACHGGDEQGENDSACVQCGKNLGELG